MIALIIYCIVTFILAILISLMYSVLATRAKKHGWSEEEWGGLLLPSLIFIVLAPITVPWWLVCFIRANRLLKSGGGG